MKYRPRRVRLLLIAESPPVELDRYFYFEDEGSEEPLYRQLCEVLFEAPLRPGGKPVYLAQLRRRGVFVTELKPDAPRQREPLAPYVPWLVLGIEPLAAEHVILVGNEVYQAAQRKLAAAGFPVVAVPVPVPAPGQEEAFRRELRKALIRAGLERTIRPLTRTVKAAVARDSDRA